MEANRISFIIQAIYDVLPAQLKTPQPLASSKTTEKQNTSLKVCGQVLA